MNMLMTNINPKTGIAYGLISSNALHPDVVDAQATALAVEDVAAHGRLFDAHRIEK